MHSGKVKTITVEVPPKKTISLFDYPVYMVVRLALCVIGALSLKQCDVFIKPIGWFCWNVIRFRRDIVLDNLKHAYPEKSLAERERIGLKMWQSLMLFLFEFAHIHRKINQATIFKHISIENAGVLIRALLEDRTSLIISSHHGNFEASGYLIGLFGFESATVARVMDNPYLDEFINRGRVKVGQKMIGRKDYDSIINVLENRGNLALLGDQHAGNKGAWVDFFQRPASAYKSIALFSLQYDAPLIVAHMRRKKKALQFELDVSAHLDPREESEHNASPKAVCQWFTSEIEKQVRLAPEQYWWVHRRWKEKVARRRRPRRKKVTQKTEPSISKEAA